MVENELAKAVSADKASLFVLDREAGVLVKTILDAASYWDDKAKIEVPIDGDSNVAICYRSKESFMKYNLPPEASKFGYLMKNLLCIPIMSPDGVIGVIQLLNKIGDDRFSSLDEQTCMKYAVMLGYLIRKGLDENASASSVDQLEKIVELGVKQDEDGKMQRLAEEIFHAAKHRLAKIVNADRTSVFLVDKTSHKLYTIVQQGTPRIELDTGTGMVGHVAQTGQTMRITDAYDCPYFNKSNDEATGYRTRTALMVPIHGGGGKIIGVVQALNKKGSASFTENDEKALTEFAGQIAIAYEMKSEAFGMFVDAFERGFEK